MSNETQEPAKQEQPAEWVQLDLFSDEPLVCTRNQDGDTTCESCQ